MIGLIQRVKSAKVSVGEEVIGSIGQGILLLLGVSSLDAKEEANELADKVANLRLFSDERGNLSLSLTEIKGEILVVSQFTLLGDTRKGRRPSFTAAAEPLKAKKLYEAAIDRFLELGFKVETGSFGAMMDVEIINDGPVTLIVKTKNEKPPLC